MNTSKLIPYYVALELTKACDLRCIHCGSAADTHNRDEPLSLGQWKTLINDLKDLGTRDFQLSGGEPFLYQYWRELVYHIRTSQNIPASVTFITNGQQPEVDDVRYCKEMGVSHFAVSLDGPQSIHSYIRQSKKAFDRVLRLIKLCNSEKLPISILTAVNSYNINHLDELKHILLPLNIYTWQLQVVNY